MYDENFMAHISVFDDYALFKQKVKLKKTTELEISVTYMEAKTDLENQVSNAVSQNAHAGKRRCPLARGPPGAPAASISRGCQYFSFRGQGRGGATPKTGKPGHGPGCKRGAARLLRSATPDARKS